MVSKVLVTTSLEETWPDNPDVPVLFLGEWCRLYSRRERWQKMNVEVIPYHWDDRNKLYNDYHIINRNYEELLQLLSNQLNKIHGLKHDLRYWRILIGVWLGYFLQVLFDRWYMLKYAIENYNISKVYAHSRVAAISPSFLQLYPEGSLHSIVVPTVSIPTEDFGRSGYLF